MLAGLADGGVCLWDLREPVFRHREVLRQVGLEINFFLHKTTFAVKEFQYFLFGAPSDISTSIEGSTYPRKKLGCYGLLKLFSSKENVTR